MKLKKLLMTILMLPVMPGIFVGSDDAEEKKDEDADQEEEKKNDAEDKGGKDEEEKLFTQSEVNKMMSREKKQGRSGLLKELGFKTSDDAKAYVDKYRKQEDANKTDEQKQNENDQKLTETQNKLAIAEAKVQALEFDAKPEFVDDIITLAMARISEDNDDLKEIFTELKSKHPVMFRNPNEDEKENAGKKGTGKNPDNRNKGTAGKDDEKSLGARLAASRRSSTVVKSHYFSK